MEKIYIGGTICSVLSALCNVGAVVIGVGTSYGRWLLVGRYLFGSLSFWTTSGAIVVDYSSVKPKWL